MPPNPPPPAEAAMYELVDVLREIAQHLANIADLMLEARNNGR